MKKNKMKQLMAIGLTGSMAAASGMVCCAEETIPAMVTYADAYNRTVEDLKGDLFHYGYEDPVSVKIGKFISTEAIWREGETVDDNVWERLYKDLGYERDLLFSVDGSQQDTKMATAISSGEYPDIMMVSVTDMQEYAKSGVIADITDIYEEYASDELKAYVNWNGENNLTATTVDGKVYGVPKRADRRTDAMMLFLRKDWLDNLGMEIPTTVEELKAVAKAFTENDPDGNGVADTYGLGICGKEGFFWWSGVETFFECYGAAPGHWCGTFQFLEKDGEIVWGGSLVDEMKAALTDLQEMYQEGWLAKSFTTMDNVQIQSDIASGSCGMYFAPNWGSQAMQVELAKTNPDADLIAVPLPDGMGEGSAKSYIPVTTNECWVISSKCEHPEAIIKLLNVSAKVSASSEDAEQLALFEAPGSGLYVGSNSWPVQLGYTLGLEDERAVCEAVTTGEIPEDLPEKGKASVKNVQLIEAAFADGTYADLVAAGDEAIMSAITSNETYGANGGMRVSIQQVDEGRLNQDAYNAIPTDAMNSKFTTLNKMTLETIIKIICGDSVDTYDTFLESWYKLGGDAVMQDAQAWYAENAAK